MSFDKCPNCGYEEIKSMTFEEFMDSTIKRISDKQKKEYGYGIPENNQKENSKKRKKAR